MKKQKFEVYNIKNRNKIKEIVGVDFSDFTKFYIENIILLRNLKERAHLENDLKNYIMLSKLINAIERVDLF